MADQALSAAAAKLEAAKAEAFALLAAAERAALLRRRQEEERLRIDEDARREVTERVRLLNLQR